MLLKQFHILPSYASAESSILTHFSPVSHFYATFGFLTFLGSIEM